MNELKRMLPRHHTIVTLALAGLSERDIAGQLEMTPQAIGMILRSPIVQDELSRRRTQQEHRNDEEMVRGVSKAREILNENSATAASKMVELLDSPDPRVAQMSAKDILDRTLAPAEGGRGMQVTVLSEGAIQLLQVALSEDKELKGPSVASVRAPQPDGQSGEGEVVVAPVEASRQVGPSSPVDAPGAL